MSDLRACFEAGGFSDVQTYIQSGNVVFAAPERSQAKLAVRIESTLTSTFGYEALVVLRSHRQLKAVVAGAPSGFGGEPKRYRYDVIFLKQPLTPAKAMKSVTTRDGVDEVSTGPGVIYFRRLASRASQSHVSRLAGLPVYREMTVRNWNTTTKLVAMMDAGKGEPS